MIKIVYFSRSGNIKSIVDQLENPSLRIENGKEIVNEPYVLMTSSIGYGEIPPVVQEFLKNNSKLIKAVAGSGSMARHADTFNFASKKISKEYNVDLLVAVDGKGTSEDLQELKIKLEKFN